LTAIFIQYSCETMFFLSIVACRPSRIVAIITWAFPILKVLIHPPPAFLVRQILYTASMRSSSLYMLNSSGDFGHPCLTPMPTFSGYKYSPSIRTLGTHVLLIFPFN